MIISTKTDPWKNAKVVFIENVSSVDDLFEQLDEKLNLPAYFGFNWNALYDCLCDLSWILEKSLIIIHADKLALPKGDLENYIQVVKDAAEDWARDRDEKHDITFFYNPVQSV